MNRKQFLRSLGGGVPLCFAFSAGLSADSATDFHAKRNVTEFSGEIDAPPEAVFPLLCPVREYEWLKGWSCEMVYSQSGVAEENCIFKTALGAPAAWNVDSYEPPRQIRFTVISAEQVFRLKITLETTSAGGTKITWNRTYTGLNEGGNSKIHEWSTDRDRYLTQAIEHFLKTGKMLAE
jgi:uncharacterized protein YndB with AHSA1/START domain